MVAEEPGHISEEMPCKFGSVLSGEVQSEQRVCLFACSHIIGCSWTRCVRARLAACALRALAAAAGVQRSTCLRCGDGWIVDKDSSELPVALTQASLFDGVSYYFCFHTWVLFGV